MTKLILSCFAACALVVVLAGCSSDEHKTTTTTYDSSVSDTKDVHHRR